MPEFHFCRDLRDLSAVDFSARVLWFGLQYEWQNGIHMSGGIWGVAMLIVRITVRGQCDNLELQQ